jgi:phage terminase large subunit-like protein
VTLSPLPTRSSLLPEARHLILPQGIVTSGFPKVRETCRQVGIEFDPWQVGLNRCLLGKRDDGLYAANITAFSIARQVGKTFDVGAVVFALCIATPNTTVVWTAHRFKVARETFNELRSLAKSPKMTPHLDYDAITTAAGNECIPFRNGSRIIFAARERGAVRGFSKVAVLILDEAQILTDATLSDLAPTMNQAANPLIILMGTPPKPTDPSEVFTRLRTEALSNESDDILYVEISAETDADSDDRAAWRQANPSYPHRTPERSILRLRKLLSEDDFRREALGIWDDESSLAVIPPAKWAAGADIDAGLTDDTTVAFAIDVTPDRKFAAIGAAGAAPGDKELVDVVDYRPGVDWVVARVLELRDTHNPCAIVLDRKSPAGGLLPDFAAAGVEITEIDTTEALQACEGFYDAVIEDRLRHLSQPSLNAAVKGALKRELSEGGWLWDRKKSTDISSLVAVSYARWAWTVYGQAPREFWGAWG